MLRSHALAFLLGFLFFALLLARVAFLVLDLDGVSNQGPSGGTKGAPHSGAGARGAESGTHRRTRSRANSSSC
jgi:hypothetical protein